MAENMGDGGKKLASEQVAAQGAQELDKTTKVASATEARLASERASLPEHARRSEDESNKKQAAAHPAVAQPMASAERSKTAGDSVREPDAEATRQPLAARQPEIVRQVAEAEAKPGATASQATGVESKAASAARQTDVEAKPAAAARQTEVESKPAAAARQTEVEAKPVAAEKLPDTGRATREQHGDTDRNQAGQAVRDRAQAFANKPPTEAVKEHPELAGTYAAMASMDRKVEANNLTPQQQAVVAERIRQNIANSIERGEVPQVQVRDRTEVKREVKEEREMTR